MAGSHGQTKTVVASGAQTATGNSGVLTLPPRLTQGTLVLACTAASGTTPTLDVFLQTSYDGGTTWDDVAAFTRVTAAARRILAFGPDRVSTVAADAVSGDGALAAGSVKPYDLTKDVRIKWVIGGTTPSFTFAVLLASGDVDL